MRGVAINIGANTNQPGFRGPIFDDGRFEYVPIPESEPTRSDASVPTYADLDLTIDVSEVADVPVHLDPTFAGVHGATAYTYGDPHGVKARPLLELEAGDYVFFYATLSTAGSTPAEWITPEWGAYIIGQFRLDEPPIDATDGLTAADRSRVEGNAHLKRDPFDARVLLSGDESDSSLYDVALPLSTPKAGIEANRLVTELSSDSGAGPWWRRPLRFDHEATARLLDIQTNPDRSRVFD